MRIWEIFPEVAERIRKTHEEVGLFGHHDFAHAFRVGELAYQFALSEWRDRLVAQSAGLAGMSHNADHIFWHMLGREKYKQDPDIDKKVGGLVSSWLDGLGLKNNQVELVIRAVLNHQKPNEDGDNNVTIALKDADRVANMDADVIIRAGQSRPNIPAVDLKYFLDNPEATFKEPGSVLKDIHFLLEWADPKMTKFCVRTKLAMEMASKRANFLKDYIDLTKSQLINAGFYPYPFKN